MNDVTLAVEDASTKVVDIVLFIGPKSDHCLALTVDTISLTPVVETINDMTLAVKDASAKVVDIFVIDRLVTVDT